MNGFVMRFKRLANYQCALNAFFWVVFAGFDLALCVGFLVDIFWSWKALKRRMMNPAAIKMQINFKVRFKSFGFYIDCSMFASGCCS